MQLPAYMLNIGQGQVPPRVGGQLRAAHFDAILHDLRPFDGVSGCAWLRRDFDRNNGPRARLLVALCAR